MSATASIIVWRSAVAQRNQFMTTVRNSNAALDQRGVFGSAVSFFPVFHGAIQPSLAR